MLGTPNTRKYLNPRDIFHFSRRYQHFYYRIFFRETCSFYTTKLLTVLHQCTETRIHQLIVNSFPPSLVSRSDVNNAPSSRGRLVQQLYNFKMQPTHSQRDTSHSRPAQKKYLRHISPIAQTPVVTKPYIHHKKLTQQSDK